MVRSCLKIISMIALLSMVISPSFSRVQAETADEQKQVFQKFFEVTGAQSQYNQMLDIMVRQFQQSFVAALRQQAAKVQDASKEDQDRMIELLRQALLSYMDKLRNAVIVEMPFQELIDKIYYPIYSKYFNASDLKEVIQFYESAVGQKFVSMTPVLMQESVAGFNRQYGQKLQDLSTRLAEEEFAKIKPELDKLDKKTD